MEFSALRDELTRIAETTEFNGIGLIDGTLASSVATTSHTLIQIGIDNSENSRLDLNDTLKLDAITSSTLGLASLSVTAAAEALTALSEINTAIAAVTAARGKVGAVQNRLQRSVSALSITSENLQAAESAIRDADTVSYTHLTLPTKA